MKKPAKAINRILCSMSRVLALLYGLCVNGLGEPTPFSPKPLKRQVCLLHLCALLVTRKLSLPTSLHQRVLYLWSFKNKRIIHWLLLFALGLALACCNALISFVALSFFLRKREEKTASTHPLANVLGCPLYMQNGDTHMSFYSLISSPQVA